jgi:alanine racemase
LHKIRKSFDHTRPLIEVGISRVNLLHNFHEYQKAYPQFSFAPVLKSNAYGHGLVEVASILDTEPISFFVVDSYYEARVLRAAGIESSTLVLGYTRPEDIAQNRLKKIAFALVDIEQVRSVTKIARKPLHVHIKLDTGMHRHGIEKENLDEAIALLSGHRFIEVAGVCSHLGDADSSTSSMTDGQRARWNELVPIVMRAFPHITIRHFAATKGVRFGNEADANVIRLGIGLYGLDTSPGNQLPLKPVLELRTVVSSVRRVPRGEHVGYNGTFVTERTTRLATLPIGYFEGIDRRLSNLGSMLIHGKAAPIAGRVSMNMTSLDVTDIPEVQVLDTVIAISRDLLAPNSVRSIAAQTNRIPYDVLVHVPPHLRRIVE